MSSKNRRGKGTKASEKINAIKCDGCLVGFGIPTQPTKECPCCGGRYHQMCLELRCTTTRKCSSEFLHAEGATCPAWVPADVHKHRKFSDPICSRCARWERRKDWTLNRNPVHPIYVPRGECEGEDAVVRLFQKYVEEPGAPVALLAPGIYLNEDFSPTPQLEEITESFSTNFLSNQNPKSAGGEGPYRMHYKFSNATGHKELLVDGCAEKVKKKMSPQDILSTGEIIDLTEESSFEDYDRFLRARVNKDSYYQMDLDVDGLQTEENSKGFSLDHVADGMTKYIKEKKYRGLQTAWGIVGTGGVPSPDHFEDNQLASGNVNIGLPGTDAPIGGTKIWRCIHPDPENVMLYCSAIATESGSDCIAAIRVKHYLLMTESLVKNNISFFFVFHKPGMMVLTYFATAHQVTQNRGTFSIARNFMMPTYVKNISMEPLCRCGFSEPPLNPRYTDCINYYRQHGIDMMLLRPFREAVNAYRAELLIGGEKNVQALAVAEYKVVMWFKGQEKLRISCTSPAQSQEEARHSLRKSVEQRFRLPESLSFAALRANRILVNFESRDKYVNWLRTFQNERIDYERDGFKISLRKGREGEKILQYLARPNYVCIAKPVLEEIIKCSLKNQEESSSTVEDDANQSSTSTKSSTSSKSASTSWALSSAASVLFPPPSNLVNVKLEDDTNQAKDEQVPENMDIVVDGDDFEVHADATDADDMQDLTVVHAYTSLHEDLNTLDDRKRITRHVISDYMLYLKGKYLESPVRVFRQNDVSGLHVQNIMVYPTDFFLSSSGQRPAGRIMDSHIILYPIFLPKTQHWILAIVVVDEGKLYMFDSMLDVRSGTSKAGCAPHMNIIPLIIEDLQVRWHTEVENLPNGDKKSAKKDFIVEIQPNLDYPKQDNTVDCGIDIMKYAELFLENPLKPKFSFHQMDIPTFRKEYKDLLLSLVRPKQ